MMSDKQPKEKHIFMKFRKLAIILVVIVFGCTSLHAQGKQDIPVAENSCEVTNVQLHQDLSEIIDLQNKIYDEKLDLIESNTKKDNLKDGWNVYGLCAIVVALMSLVISLLTLTAQSKTEKHTQKAPIKAQIGILKDLPRHFYRNLACTCAALLKFRNSSNRKDSKRLSYPSEANILKLTTLPDEFILPIDSLDESLYQTMHEDKLLFKNYNLEIEVAAKHFASENISDDSLKNDYDNLLFKPIFLVSRMFKLQEKIAPGNDNVSYTIYAFVKEHFAKANLLTIAKNQNNEIAFLRSITQTEDFKKGIGVLQDSIDRSLNTLFNHIGKEAGTAGFLSRQLDSNDGSEERFVIDVTIFRNYFNDNHKAEESGNSSPLFDKVTTISSEKAFRELINAPQSFDTTECYTLLKPYFEFFQASRWDASALIYTILKIDTLLELGKIGMINY